MLKPGFEPVANLAYNEDKIVQIFISSVEGLDRKDVYKIPMATRLKKAALIRFVSADFGNAQEEFVFALARKDKRMINAGVRETKSLGSARRFYSKRLRRSAKCLKTVRFFRHKVV